MNVTSMETMVREVQVAMLVPRVQLDDRHCRLSQAMDDCQDVTCKLLRDALQARIGLYQSRHSRVASTFAENWRCEPWS